MARSRKWSALDAWVLCRDDATQEAVAAQARQFKESWKHVPGLQVRWYRRTVKAGSAVVPVTVIVARAPLSAHSAQGGSQ